MKGLAKKIIFLVLYTAFLLLVVEVFFRAIDFDFSNRLRLYVKIPIYFRVPKDTICEVYFKRSGPMEWSGKIMQQYSREVYHNPDAYNDEKAIIVKYDKDGFRNPDDLKDWEIVVVGNSFMEAGYLPYESLIPTRLGKLLNVPVKNLGVCLTGTFTHICYLKTFGKAKSTKHAVLSFFEGNDIQDIKEESAALDTFYKTGKRPYKEIRNFKQTSFLKSIKILVADFLLHKKKQYITKESNAYFLGAQTKIPITASDRPKNIDSSDLKLLDQALAGWATTARGMELTPWLFYIPAKIRVLDGYLEFKNEKEAKAAQKTTEYLLPEQVKEICQKYDIKFLYLMDTLRSETEKGILTYNTLYDAHLNDHGAEVVAAKLAEFMRNEVN